MHEHHAMHRSSRRIAHGSKRRSHRGHGNRQRQHQSRLRRILLQRKADTAAVPRQNLHLVNLVTQRRTSPWDPSLKWWNYSSVKPSSSVCQWTFGSPRNARDMRRGCDSGEANSNESWPPWLCDQLGRARPVSPSSSGLWLHFGYTIDALLDLDCA